MVINSKDELLQYMKEHHGSDNPLNRTDLKGQEITWANQLVKEGTLEKGSAPKGNSLSKGLVVYYMPQPTWYYSKL